MDAKLELYYYPECPYCQRVLRAASQLNITEKLELKNIHADAQAYKTLIEVGGMGQVPCLFIDGVPMYESGDIVAWLQRQFS